jgi:PKHD-type hydroxylase
MSTNDHIAAVFIYRGVLSAEECERVRALAARRPLADVDYHPEPAQPVRRASTKVLEMAGENLWLAQRLLGFALRANASFRFEIDDALTSAMCVSYREGDFFNWHTDLGDGPESRRKISISLQLSEPRSYEGGQLQMVSFDKPLEFPQTGDMAVFPAHLAHRVTPVTRGERQALVAWVCGPAFR